MRDYVYRLRETHRTVEKKTKHTKRFGQEETSTDEHDRSYKLLGPQSSRSVLRSCERRLKK